MGNLNSADFLILAILAIFAFSIMGGLLRGLWIEILSLSKWIAASIVSTLCTAKLAASFSGAASDSANVFGPSQSLALVTSPTTATPINAAPSFTLLSTGVTFVCLFFAMLLLSSFLMRSLTPVVENRNVTLVHHLLGAVLGGIRGFLITTYIIFLTQLTPIGQQSAWKSSPLVVVFQPIVKVINYFVQE